MLKRKALPKRLLPNIGGIVCLIASLLVIYYILRQDHTLPMSIHSVWLYISHWGQSFRILAVGLLPIYVALMVFGTAAVGIYCGSLLQRWITRLFGQKTFS